ncbi:MAG TPA: PIN domain-containing protein [Candidatus Angelobacter sp.]|jgi:predicted nucleic acid-binding protein|nr:PIN domain-containing protein [Candidatus Angelobacter sp.]
MNPRKSVIVDANILIRAVLGQRVQQILEQFEDAVLFYTPDICLSDARHYLQLILERRGIDPAPGMTALDQISKIVQSVDRSLYEDYEEPARERIKRDPDDWPIIAVALLIGGPIWTEDQDFFGTGIPIWTTDRIEVYLRQ